MVDLAGVVSCDLAAREVLAVAGARARTIGIALHVVDPGAFIATDRFVVADDAWPAA